MSRPADEKGQALPIVVGGMIGLLAFGALVLDLGMVYSLQRTERAAADAAALAGAQQLQVPNTHTIDSAHQVAAVQYAMENLKQRFGATGFGATSASDSNCTPVAGGPVVSVTDCALLSTPYWITIKTPSPSAVNVDRSRAVQVTVLQPSTPLTLARLLGQHDWRIGTTSVAGLSFGGQYAIMTLRPPVSGRTGNAGDVTINGTGSAVVAVTGDIGMNTGATLNGHSATVSVSDGYYVWYYGATTDTSTPPGPAAYRQLRNLVPDPRYMIPDSTSAGVVAGGADTDSVRCANAISTANAAGYALPSTTVCYTPGVYPSSSSFLVKNGDYALLEPGVYWFNGGITNKGVLVGGYAPNSPGVAVVVPQSMSFISNGGGGGSANWLALNRGSAWASSTPNQACSDGTTQFCATPALMPDGTTRVETNTTPPMVLSVIVPGDSACPVVVPAPTCAKTSHQTIQWTGSGSATVTAVAGVVYAPSDWSQVAGNSDPRGYLGQLVSWTITYSGGSTLNQNYPGSVTNGIMALDAACSGPGAPCTP